MYPTVKLKPYSAGYKVQDRVQGAGLHRILGNMIHNYIELEFGNRTTYDYRNSDNGLRRTIEYRIKGYKEL